MNDKERRFEEFSSLGQRKIDGIKYRIKSVTFINNLVKCT